MKIFPTSKKPWANIGRYRVVFKTMLPHLQPFHLAMKFCNFERLTDPRNPVTLPQEISLILNLSLISSQNC